MITGKERSIPPYLFCLSYKNWEWSLVRLAVLSSGMCACWKWAVPGGAKWMLGPHCSATTCHPDRPCLCRARTRRWKMGLKGYSGEMLVGKLVTSSAYLWGVCHN